eukprot:37233-Rhodomonas_salina.3
MRNSSSATDVRRSCTKPNSACRLRSMIEYLLRFHVVVEIERNFDLKQRCPLHRNRSISSSRGLSLAAAETRLVPDIEQGRHGKINHLKEKLVPSIHSQRLFCCPSLPARYHKVV